MSEKPVVSSDEIFARVSGKPPNNRPTTDAQTTDNQQTDDAQTTDTRPTEGETLAARCGSPTRTGPDSSRPRAGEEYRHRRLYD